MKKELCRLFFLIALAMASSVLPVKSGEVAQGSSFQGFELVRETVEPAIGEPVTVRIRAREGFPSHTMIKWTLMTSGGPAENAAFDSNRPSVYSFTPMGPGTFQLLADVVDVSGTPITVASVPMVIRIGDHSGSLEQPAGPITLSLLPFNEAPPRVGVMLDYGEGIPPNNRTIEWIVSGSRIDDPKIDGTHKDVYSFIPGAPGDYTVTARLYDADRNLMDEVTEVFSFGD